jgi:hypothetical protein
MLDAIFEALLGPFSGVPPAVTLLVASLVTSALMLLIFRVTSNQEAIRRAKAKMMSQVLAIRLFPDDPWITVRCLGGTLHANLGYLRHVLIPLAVMFLPVALILIQLDLRFSRLPLRRGDATTVGVTLMPMPMLGTGGPRSVAIKAPAGLSVETPPVRIPALFETDWRIRALKEGEHEILFEVDGRTFTKKVVVGEGLRCLPATRTGNGLLSAMLHPGEPPLSPDLGVESITLDYPVRPFRLLGFRLHWLAAYFLLSLILAFALKKPLGVEA